MIGAKLTAAELALGVARQRRRSDSRNAIVAADATAQAELLFAAVIDRYRATGLTDEEAENRADALVAEWSRITASMRNGGGR